ncbi:hypothetical protein CGCTS75_v003448 [Colletotrichum tropicale]|nr:hypothetical protein CGCTS75_v003448 [Colletotrichum tropicale]
MATQSTARSAVREFEFDIHQPGGAPVDNSFCTTPCFVDPNAPCGTLSNMDAGRKVFGKHISISAILVRYLYARTYNVHLRLSPDIIDSNWKLENLYSIEVFGSLFIICPKPGHFEDLDLF